ncbi:MAG: SufS family cysteine desulfurase [Alphaproteobacteria bacterium]|nr:SufS family cysteine desulfurase [Alphaproteobacteria bacterium]
MYDVYQIRKDFSIFSELVNEKPVAYLDSAASAQKPHTVIAAMERIYQTAYANPHRGTYYFADSITNAYEQAREIVRQFLNARSTREIVFTRNATEAINLVAATWARQNIKADDEILISEAEHHANLVPWQQICLEKGAKLVVFPVSDKGEYLSEEFLTRLSDKTKLVAVTAMSNVLGTIFPIKEITAAAHSAGAKVLIDACQYVVHCPLDVQDIDCDFAAFSGHKTYGPTGIGALYGKSEILENLPPYQFGGDMVDNVTFKHTTFADIPARFEAGTPASVQAVGMAEGLKYMFSLGFDNIMKHEAELTAYTTARLSEVPNLKIIGTAPNKGGVFGFAIDNIHPQDIAFVLNKENVAIRIGHHCAQPIVNRMGYQSLARASLGLYTTKEDIDALINALLKAEKFFRES